MCLQSQFLLEPEEEGNKMNHGYHEPWEVEEQAFWGGIDHRD